MAGEFTKRTEDGQNVWTCVTCGQEIVIQSKPRNHLCMNDENVTGQQNNVRTDSTSLNPDSFDFTPSMLRHPFSTPPPNFNAAPPQAGNHEAMYQFQAEQNRLQAQNYKDMMMFIQQQNLEMQQKHQQTLLKQQEQNDERVRQQNLEMRQQHQESLRMQQDQNETRMNQLMETMKLNKSETKVKCPKWEKEENVKNFINRLKRWNDVEKGKEKYLQLLESLQESDRKRGKTENRTRRTKWRSKARKR